MRFFRYLLGTLFIVITVWIIYPKLAASAENIPLLFREANKLLLPLLVVFQGLAYFGDGWLSKILLGMVGFKIKLRDTVRVAFLGVIGNQIIPVFGGTAITYHLYRKFGISFNNALFLIFAWTFLVWTVYLLSLILSLFFIPKSYFYLLSLENILIGAAFLLVVGYLLLRRRGRTLINVGLFLIKLINKIVSYFTDKKNIKLDKVRILIDEFFRDLELVKKHKAKFGQALLAAILFYAGNLATLYVSFLVFGFKPEFALLVLGYVLSWILAVLILVPETPGVIEASLVGVFIALGFPAHISLLASLLFRLFSYWLLLPLAVHSYLKLKRKFAIK